MSADFNEFSFKELIGLSIKSEIDANEYYTEFSENAIGELMAERFQSLARDEEVHKDALLKIHEGEFGDKDYVVPEGKKLPPTETKFKFTNVANMIDSLEKGIVNENSARRIYKHLSKRKEKYATEFEYLAIMEKGHAESLKAEKQMLEGKVKKEPETKGLSLSEFWKQHKNFHPADHERTGF